MRAPRSALLFLLALTLLPLGLASDADARCARALYLPQMVTPTDQPLPVTATFLVALTRRYGGAHRQLDRQLPENAALVQGDTRIALRRVIIGAGLARYEPASRPAPGAYTVEGLGDPIAVTFARRGTLRVRPPQPPRRVGITVGRMRIRGRRGGTRSSRAVRATLPRRGQTPAALIAYYDGQPGAASVVPEGVRDLVLFQETLRCASPLPGTRMPRPGEGIELAAVNAFGRVSPRVRKR